MKALLFGATGMIGRGVLLECLDDPRVASVIVVGRRPCGVTHPKVIEILREDLSQLADLRATFAERTACFYCLGVSAAGLSEAAYAVNTYELTLAVAREVLAAAPSCAFLYISGQGADSSERGRIMWARVKGRTENALLRLGFRAVAIFRPGFIQPLRGVQSRTALYRVFYAIAGPLLPFLPRWFPKVATTTVALGRAMIEVGLKGSHLPILETADINRVARNA